MGGRRKPWLELAGRPVLAHALAPLLAHPGVVAVRVAVASGDADAPPGWLRELDPRVEVVAGGATRAESVREAVRALPPCDVVLVHDAARPLLDAATVARCVDAVRPDRARAEVVGAVAGWRAVDTLKRVEPDTGRIVETPDRSRIWHAQTPQAFVAETFRLACESLDELAARAPLTDDASLLEAWGGGEVVMVEGAVTNLKVTRPEDLPVAELLLSRMS